MHRLLLFLLFALPGWGAIGETQILTTPCAATASLGASCTLTATSTANDIVVVGLAWKTITRSIKKVAGSSANAVFMIYPQQKSASSVSAIIVCRYCPALTTITPTFSGTTDYVLSAADYSGVTWLGKPGINTATSTLPGLTFTTGDANNWIVVATSSLGNAGIPTAGTGTLRGANRSGTANTNVAGALIDNTVASAGSVTATATITSGVWVAAGIELRTTTPPTYIWPDCDTLHTCLIYHYGRPAIPLEADGPLFNYWVRPSLTNNLLVIVVTHPGTVSTVADAGGSNTWTHAGTGVANGTYTTDMYYVCGAAVGSGGKLSITLNAAITASDIMQVNYYEFSGINTTSGACGDGYSTATAQAAGPMNPGSITTTVDGDAILTFGIDGSGNQTNGFPAGHEQPDDLSADIFDSVLEDFMSMLTVQTTHGAINPTIYGTGEDINEQNGWQLLVQAFKFSSGAGTQPPTGRAWVVRDIIEWTSTAVTAYQIGFPTNGNVLEVDATHYQTLVNFTTLKDNTGDTFTANPITDTTADPQQYYSCLGSAVTSRDRVFTLTPGATATITQLYDISGAKTTGGSTGCVGNKSNHNLGTQGAPSNTATANANVVSSLWSTAFTFTPTLNGSAYSVIIFNMGFGAGPPSGPCNTGGIGPTCTNDMTPFNFGSVFATNMTDASHYTTGDVYGWYSANVNNASAVSFDFLMANSVGQPGGGTSTDAAALEILGQPSPCSNYIALIGVGCK
jgi:hypothetical protein